FAALLEEIAWTRVLVMVIGGSTYAFTLVLFFFLLGIGIGSAMVARRNVAPLDTAATATLALGITVLGATMVVVALSSLANYILIIFGPPAPSAAAVLVRLGIALGVVLLPATIGMG